MNPVPFLFRFAVGWPSIKAQIDAYALDHLLPPYSTAPQLYRFEGWGTVGFPPRLACNVKYKPGDPIAERDLGRIVAR